MVDFPDVTGRRHEVRGVATQPPPTGLQVSHGPHDTGVPPVHTPA